VIEVVLGRPILRSEPDGEAATTMGKHRPLGLSKEVYERTF
jgi:hypothetical protein